MGFLKRTVIITVIIALCAVVMQWINAVDIEEYYKNKRIILTGASAGIGKDLAIQLSQLGARLVIAARTESKLLDTQKQCQNYSQDVFAVKADVGKEEDIKMVVNEAVKQLGGIDILILNAAYFLDPTPFEKFEDHEAVFQKTYSVNVLQGVYFAKYSLPYLKKSNGSILAVSSGAGWTCCARFSPYTASKHALQGFFGTLNMELLMENANVGITIMPLPYVYTDHAIDVMKLKPSLLFQPGITSEDCAGRMIRGLPLNKLYHYITWDSFIIGRFYSLMPYYFDLSATYFMQYFADAFAS